MRCCAASGSITLAQALRPAIGYAEGGFPVTPIIAAEWATQVAKLRNDEGARTTYLVDDGRAPPAGAWFQNPDLARSLRLIAEQGIGALYGGELRPPDRGARARPRRLPDSGRPR